MANGYEKGDYLAQFLNQLPQIYRAKQNIDLQRERLQYMKEEGFKDEIYRAQVLTANEQTNKLARQEFEEKQQQNLYAKKQREFNNNLQTDANERADFQLEAGSFTPGSKAHNTWLLNQKHVTENPIIEKQIRETFEIEDDLTDRIRATVGMEPLAGLEELRRISQDRNQTNAHFELIQTLEKKFLEAAEVTQAELAMQPSYKNLENERELLQGAREHGPRATQKGLESLEDYRKRVSDIQLNVQSYEADVMEEARSAQGVYPGLSIPFYEKFPMNEPMYDNIDDIPDTEVDEVLSGLGAPAIESNVLPPEFQAPPERPTTPPQMYTEDSLGVPADVEAVAPEDATLLMPARDFSGFSSEEMKQYGTQVFFDKDTNRWYDLQTMEPATISQIRRHQGKDKPKKLSANQKNNINRIVKQMAQLKTRTYDKKILEGKINRLKNKILNIDPNYKFKD